jgi:predicted RNA binding protein YcfA (HicA-like mRNA interferase family)
MSAYSKDKEISKLVKQLIKSGWAFKQGKKHGLIYAPKGGRITVPCTPSDWRAHLNFKRNLKELMNIEVDYV